jgi:hypothetical protein
MDENSVLIHERHGNSVQLQLSHVLNVRAPGKLEDATVEIAQFVHGVGIVERKHGSGVSNLEELLRRLAPDSLGGRIRRDELGVVAFKLLQSLDQLVEFEVRDLRLVPNVIEELVATDLFTQFLYLFFDGLGQGRFVPRI